MAYIFYFYHIIMAYIVFFLLYIIAKYFYIFLILMPNIFYFFLILMPSIFYFYLIMMACIVVFLPYNNAECSLIMLPPKKFLCNFFRLIAISCDQCSYCQTDRLATNSR